MSRHPGPGRPTRGFRIVDGCLAIAVAALGLSWARAYWAETAATLPSWDWRLGPSRWLGATPFYRSARSAGLLALYLGTTLAAPAGVALVVIRRLRYPASPFWRARRPGALACLASSGVLVLLLATRAIWPASHNLHIRVGPAGEVRAVASARLHDANAADRGGDPLLHAALAMPRFAGFVVGGAWLALAMAGRWRPERSWVDRLGRAIGVFWIAAAVHFFVLPL